MAESDPISAAWARTQAAGGDTEYASQRGRIDDREHPPGAPRPRLERGAVVGRYLILGKLGEGGMGVVYTAHDPELDRKVALKLMRGEGAKASTSGAPVRLLREAQALARLAHPNVVAIHDVGALGDDIWLAMEHIDGQTLSAWLKEQPRTWRQIVAIFRQAGEGLAAAHAAGLVHRDFKPDNVLVGADGRARVLDFGLASRSDRAPSAAAAAPLQHGPEAIRSGSSSSLLASISARSVGSSDLSRDGAIVGTPAYMSPEQHLGLDVDARGDVFSFCVALWEALHGAHPYAAATLAELVFAITRGDQRPGATRRRIPRWLHRLLLRGLHPDPSRRFADARALVDALTRGLRTRRRLLTFGALALAAAAALALTLSLLRADLPVLPCQGVEQHLAGVWDDARQRQLRAAIFTSGDANAATTWERARDHIDGYTRAWVVMQRDACEATHLRGEQSPDLMDLRVTCLRRHLAELRALLDLLVEADPQVIARTITAIQALPPLDRCADLQALQSPIPPPADPRARRQIDALEQRLALVHASLSAGRFADGLARAEAIAADATTLAHRPLDAEIALRRGQLLDRSGAHVAAEEALRGAAFLAVGARHDVIAAEAMTELIYHLGLRRARPDEGLEWSRHAEAAIARLAPGREREQLEATRLDREGLVRTATGDLVGGRALQERALAQMIAVHGPDQLQSAALRLNLSATLADLGEPEPALDHLRAAAEVFARELGAEHLHLAAIHNNLGTLLDGQGDYVGALEHHRRALAIKQHGLGPEHPALANSHNNLGGTLIHLHRLDEAERHLEIALAIKAAAYGADAPQSIDTLGLLADLHLERGEHQRALAAALSAIERARAAYGDDHPGQIALLAVAGDAARALGRPDEARVHLERALALARAHGAEASVRGRVERSLAALSAP